MNSQVQVFPTDDDGVCHLRRVDDASEDAAADRDVAGKGALLVDVRPVDGLCDMRDQRSTILRRHLFRGSA